MSVKKQKNGKWLCQIDRKGLKRVRKTFPTQREAEIFEREYVFGLKIKPVKINDPRTMIELINIWYKYHGINLARPETFKRQLLVAAEDLGNPIAHTITPELFVQYRYKLMTSDKPLTGKTINNLHGLIDAVFNRLKKLQIISYENPIAAVDKLKLDEKQMSYLSLPQIDELLESIISRCQNESTWYVANICLHTGARWGEAEKLTRKQIHNGKITYVKTKSKKVRTIPLDKNFYNEILSFVKNKQPEERVFKNCINSFRKAVGRTEIILPRGQMTHVLRHSFASHFMINDGNILTLQKILGHSDIKMTMRYAHLAPNHLSEAVTRNPFSTR